MRINVRKLIIHKYLENFIILNFKYVTIEGAYIFAPKHETSQLINSLAKAHYLFHIKKGTLKRKKGRGAE
jgi:hypothetical protein